MQYILYYFLLINLFTFLIYGLDKQKAIKKQYRISEATLLTYTILGGSIGALLAMIIFHHKTKHLKFKILVPMCMILHIILLCIVKTRLS